MSHVLAMDAGGTGTRAALHAPDGTLLSRAEAGPGNLHQDRAAALATLAGLARRCLASAGPGAPPEAEICLSAGLAGLSAAGAADAVRAAFAGFGRVVLMTDSYAALTGAFAGGAGALMVIGTGSAGRARLPDGTLRRLGGWGFPAGDPGGGAWLGLQLIGAWLDRRDGIGRESRLWPVLDAALPAGRAALLAWMRAARPADYAAFARPLAEAADDPVAAALLDRGFESLLRLARGLTAGSDIDLTLTGGLAPVFVARLAGALAGPVALAAADAALRGAFLVGRGKAPPEPAEASDGS